MADDEKVRREEASLVVWFKTSQAGGVGLEVGRWRWCRLKWGQSLALPGNQAGRQAGKGPCSD